MPTGPGGPGGPGSPGSPYTKKHNVLIFFCNPSQSHHDFTVRKRTNENGANINKKLLHAIMIKRKEKNKKRNKTDSRVKVKHVICLVHSPHNTLLTFNCITVAADILCPAACNPFSYLFFFHTEHRT